MFARQVAWLHIGNLGILVDLLSQPGHGSNLVSISGYRLRERR